MRERMDLASGVDGVPGSGHAEGRGGGSRDPGRRCLVRWRASRVGVGGRLAVVPGRRGPERRCRRHRVGVGRFDHQRRRGAADGLPAGPRERGPGRARAAAAPHRLHRPVLLGPEHEPVRHHGPGRPRARGARVLAGLVMAFIAGIGVAAGIVLVASLIVLAAGVVVFAQRSTVVDRALARTHFAGRAARPGWPAWPARSTTCSARPNCRRASISTSPPRSCTPTGSAAGSRTPAAAVIAISFLVFNVIDFVVWIPLTAVHWIQERRDRPAKKVNRPTLRWKL